MDGRNPAPPWMVETLQIMEPPINWCRISSIHRSKKLTFITRSPHPQRQLLSVWIHTLLRLLSGQELLGDTTHLLGAKFLAVHIDPSIQLEMIGGHKIHKDTKGLLRTCGFLWILDNDDLSDASDTTGISISINVLLRHSASGVLCDFANMRNTKSLYIIDPWNALPCVA